MLKDIIFICDGFFMKIGVKVLSEVEGFFMKYVCMNWVILKMDFLMGMVINWFDI